MIYAILVGYLVIGVLVFFGIIVLPYLLNSESFIIFEKEDFKKDANLQYVLLYIILLWPMVLVFLFMLSLFLTVWKIKESDFCQKIADFNIGKKISDILFYLIFDLLCDKLILRKKKKDENNR